MLHIALSSPSLFIVVKLMVIDFFLIKGTFPIFARFTEILVFLCFIVLNPWGEGLIQSTYSCQLTARHPQPCQCSAAVPPQPCTLHTLHTAHCCTHCTVLHTAHTIHYNALLLNATHTAHTASTAEQRQATFSTADISGVLSCNLQDGRVCA